MSASDDAVERITSRIELLVKAKEAAERRALEELARQVVLTRTLNLAIDGLLACECSCGAVDDEGVSRDCGRCIALGDIRSVLGEHWDITDEEGGGDDA